MNRECYSSSANRPQTASKRLRRLVSKNRVNLFSKLCVLLCGLMSSSTKHGGIQGQHILIKHVIQEDDAITVLKQASAVDPSRSYKNRSVVQTDRMKDKLAPGRLTVSELALMVNVNCDNAFYHQIFMNHCTLQPVVYASV